MTIAEYIAVLRKATDDARDAAKAASKRDDGSSHDAFIAYCLSSIRWARALSLQRTPRGLDERISALEDDRDRLAVALGVNEPAPPAGEG